MLFVGTSQFLLFCFYPVYSSSGIHLQVLGEQGCLRGITAIDYTTVIEQSQLDSSMYGRSSSTPYDDGHAQSFTLEEQAKLFHLLQRRCYQSADTHQTRLALLGFFQDGLVGHHHP